jgi:hypothetical protein
MGDLDNPHDERNYSCTHKLRVPQVLHEGFEREISWQPILACGVPSGNLLA